MNLKLEVTFGSFNYKKGECLKSYQIFMYIMCWAHSGLVFMSVFNVLRR